MLDQLFKRTARNDIQVWEIETESHTGRYRTISGKLNGKMVVSEWTVPKPRNVGRSNATTAAEQGMVDAKNAWEKKKRDGYSETIDAAHTCATFHCMTAQHYSDPKRRAEALAAAAAGRLYSQKKLNGIRCIATRGGLLSRENRRIVAAPHVEHILAPLFEAFPDAIIDGELFNPELRTNLERIVSLVKKTDCTPEELAESAQNIQYWVYDGLGLGFPRDADFSVRHVALVEELMGWADPIVQVLRTDQVWGENDINALYKEYIAGDDEGQMLRLDAPYEEKRSPYLLKRKEHEDAEFVVIDIQEGDGNRSGQAGRVIIKDKVSGAESESGITGDKALRVKLLEQRKLYLGGDVTIRFNGRTVKGIPRNPRSVAWWPGGRTL